MRRIGIGIAFGVLAAGSGCATAPIPTPVKDAKPGDICIVDNPAVRTGFREAIAKNLQLKGFRPRVVAMVEDPSCPMTISYSASWVSGPVGSTITSATIVAARQGKAVGDAGFDGMINPFAYWNAAHEVAVMVQKLFPDGPNVAK